MLKFKQKYDAFNRGAKPIDEVVEDAIIDEGRRSERGELEEIRGELAYTRKIVGFLASCLTSDQQRNLAAMIGSLEEVK